MTWLTVKEAAEWLDISEAAVRKRIQRCTLAHRRSPDGHVYVYKDADETACETADETTEEVSKEDAGADILDGKKDERRPWWDIIAGVSGLLVAIGGLVYVLGLVSLWAPLARNQTADMVTAWQATSLVPKTVVAGLGVRQLVAFPLLAGGVIFVATFSAFRLVKRVLDYLAKARSHESTYTNTLASAIIVAPAYVIIVFYSAWYLVNVTRPLSQLPYPQTLVVVSIGMFILYGSASLIYWLIRRRYVVLTLTAVAIVGATFLGYRIWRYDIALTNERLQEPGAIIGALITAAIVVIAATIVYGGAVLALTVWGSDFSVGSLPKPLQGSSPWAFVAVLVCAFLAAFMLAIPSKPPLPSAQIETKNGDGVNGMLLVHTDAFWYIFEPREGTTRSTLRAIPDEKVTSVLIHPNGKN